MKAGTLRHRVTIQGFSAVQNDFGEVVKGWNDVATVWADVRFLNGREYVAADIAAGDTKTSVRIRYRKDLTQTMRIIFDGKFYDVVEVLPDSKKVYVDLVCKTGAVSG